MKKNPKVLLATPVLNTVNAHFHQCMAGLSTRHHVSRTIDIGSLVYMARDRLAGIAAQNDFDYIVWIDSDMVFNPDAIDRLIDRALEGRDFVTGLYFTRRFPMNPVIMKEIIWERQENGTIKHGATPYYDYPKDSLFEVAGCGFGLCITSVEMIGKVVAGFGQPPFDPFPALGEDYSFCWKASKMGFKCWCDSSIKAGHVGEFVYDENVYLNNPEGIIK